MGMTSAGHFYESEVQGCDQVQLSVVIPCYNEEDGIEKLYERVTAVCRQKFGDDYEFVLVNDGSRDATWQKILALTDQDPRVVGVNLSRNHGHQLALSAGLEVCSGQRILIMDAHLPDPLELLPDISDRFPMAPMPIRIVGITQAKASMLDLASPAASKRQQGRIAT